MPHWKLELAFAEDPCVLWATRLQPLASPGKPAGVVPRPPTPGQSPEPEPSQGVAEAGRLVTALNRQTHRQMQQP